MAPTRNLRVRTICDPLTYLSEAYGCETVGQRYFRALQTATSSRYPSINFSVSVRKVQVGSILLVRLHGGITWTRRLRMCKGSYLETVSDFVGGFFFVNWIGELRIGGAIPSLERKQCKRGKHRSHVHSVGVVCRSWAK